MKKILTIIMALCFLAPAYAQNYEKKVAKAQEKEIKEKMKQYKKGGYEILGSRTMEVSLAKHYAKLNELGDNGVVFDGTGGPSKSKNLAEQMALNNAIVKYANKANSTVKGRVATDIFGDAVNSEGEFEKFYSAYERLVEQKVKNVLNPSYTVVKKNPDGTYEVQAFYIVNENQARIAREQALEAAIRDSELAGEYADKVRGFAKSKIED